MDDISLDETVECNEKVSANEIKVIEMQENSNEDYISKKNVAEGMMDLTLLAANSNQLRFILTYNTKSSTFYISLALIIISLALQVCVGIALILKRTSSKKSRLIRTSQFHVSGIFIITFVNVLIAAFTTTGTYIQTDAN